MTLLHQELEPKLSLLGKVARINWILVFLIIILSLIGFINLYSVGGGSLYPWVIPQLQKFSFGLVIMVGIALIPISFWLASSYHIYFIGLILLVMVEIIGVRLMGAQRWLDLGIVQIQPSEIMKVAMVVAVANYYSQIDPTKVSRPLYLIFPICLIMLPVGLVFIQPDLGTAILLLAGGGIILFVSGVSLFYFIGVAFVLVGAIASVLISRGTSWQLLQDYQYRRIDTFLNPDSDPLGSGYQIIQSKIAIGSGGLTGKGFLNGTQTQLNFFPEKHTDFIFPVLAEEFGLFWSLIILILFFGFVLVCLYEALKVQDRFSSLLIIGLAGTFFLYFAVNLAMVTGLFPVVGIPLPLISYGGSALLSLMISFGFIQSAIIHGNKDK
ncbi:MAG: rod shape-determining protein RodA [Paracoccaceae bacterium]|nr:rod shape-determining protein RodA [Paracoccaceae bacterium]MDE2675618.1 rod shape-determining protein RodA [Paracoccaceae bacterium]MYG09528.1 rod shape-determining protein RodA [Paracoccaceae bacterium]